MDAVKLIQRLGRSLPLNGTIEMTPNAQPG